MIELSLEASLDTFSLSIDTCINSQGITAIFGPSGAGKTSLLRHIAGLAKSPDCRVVFNQSVWQNGKSKLATAKRGVAYVFQQPHLFEHLNVQQNLAFGAQRSKRTVAAAIETRIYQVLGITSLLARQVDGLSGGEKQRVAIAQAILSYPKLLLLDEPLSALDDHNKQRIIRLLKALCLELNLPMIYVSHSLSEISQLADQLVVLDQGKIIDQGDAIDLINQKQLAMNTSQWFSVHTVSAIAAAADASIKMLSIGQAKLIISASALKAYDNQAEASLEPAVMRVMLYAKDISLCLEKPTHSSIVNILPATIVAIDNKDADQCLVTLNCQGLVCFAQITLYSCHRLTLSIGKAVFAQIKAVSILNGN